MVVNEDMEKTIISSKYLAKYSGREDKKLKMHIYFCHSIAQIITFRYFEQNHFIFLNYLPYLENPYRKVAVRNGCTCCLWELFCSLTIPCLDHNLIIQI